MQHALNVSATVVGKLTQHCDQVMVCGSLRRYRDGELAGHDSGIVTVGDIDIVAISKTLPNNELLRLFLGWSDTAEVVGKKNVSATILFHGIAVDLELATPAIYEIACQRATGSKKENVRIASTALSLGLKYTKAGIIADDGSVVASTEVGVYKAIGEPFKAPWAR